MQFKKYNVALFGTCNETTWRDDIIKRLNKGIDYFNPVVDDWTPDCQKIEQEVKKQDILHLFVLTPKMSGTYSIHEITSQTMKNMSVLLLVLNEKDQKFSKGQLKSFKAQVDDLKEFEKFECLNDEWENGTEYDEGIKRLAHVINQKFINK